MALPIVDQYWVLKVILSSSNLGEIDVVHLHHH